MADRETLSKYLRRVTGDLRSAQLRVLELEQGDSEPVAVIGMSCRYPGTVRSPADLWRLVAEEADGVSGFPEDRGWDLERLYDPDPDRAGTSYVREGGFLRDLADFDADFFSISPREALATDPQQRLLLEASWEALEDAGIDPLSLSGGDTGVFAGSSAADYGINSRLDRELEGHYGVGTSPSVISGRVAYALGLEGPAITVDTACSSSLVAMHLAAQALRRGECSLTLAGGITALSSPRAFVEFSRQRGLSTDGRCKSFAEAADGVGWSEGVGMLVLERLSDAKANNHPILAVLKGSAVNQDGASNGLTAPNGPSQERVIRQALVNARLEPGDIDAVEAHGTGTTLGDPIEAGALLATYGQERERPLKLGSIKSNIGHTQAAAGVAGVIKMVMAMREGVLPKTLHVDAPSSKVDWEAGEIELLREAEPWEPNGHPRRAAVSSFGISGTNAHVILEEAPASEPSEEQEATTPLAGPTPLVLSAKTEPALREAASRLSSHLKTNPDLDPTDLAYSLTTTRATFEHRAVALGEGREELLSALGSISGGTVSPNALLAKASQGKLAYLFTGQGAQEAGMGKELYEAYPAYASALEEVCAELDPHLGRSLKELLFAEPGSPEAELLDQTTFTQPALFATELALARLFESFGLKPDLLCGHSIGEITAAHLAGVFDLTDATKLIAARGALMGALPDGGAMVAIEATEAEVKESLQGKEAELSIAAINAPSSVVLSGAQKAIEETEAHWEEKGKRTKRLSVSHAFHSALMEPMLEEFAEVAKTLTYREPQIPIVSNLTGELLTSAQAQDPAYWVSHVREPVRFADGIATLHQQGTSTYLELGPGGVLSAMASECLTDQEAQPTFIPTLREGRAEPEAITAAIAGAHSAGATLDWSAFFKGTGAKQVPLPTYPFQRKRYWLSSTAASSDPSAIGMGTSDHPLLGAAVQLASGEQWLFTGRLSLQTHPWLADHAVSDAVLLPGTAFVELVLRVGAELQCETLEELTLQAPLILPEQGAVQIQLSVTEAGDEGNREIQIHSRPDTEEAGEWTLHAEGTLSPEPPASSEPLPTWPPAGATEIDVTDLYQRLADQGLNYGPAFQGLTAAWQDAETLYAEVSLGEEQAQEAGRFGVHPALLDAALHSAALSEEKEQGPKLPFSWSGVSLSRQGASELRVALRVDGDRLSLDLADQEGTPVATVSSLALRPLSTEQLQGQGNQEGLLGVEWAEVSTSGDAAGAETELWRFEPAPGPDPATSARAGAAQTLEVIQGWLAAEHPLDSRLAILTQGAIATNPEESPDLGAAAIWGLIRSAQAEHPGRFCLVDVDGSDASEQALSSALEGEEPQLAIREGRVLEPKAARAVDLGDSLLPPAGPWRLDATERGTLESLSLLPSSSAVEPLGPTEVRIAMRAAGLNFRDVLVALGIYPGEASIGGEGAGVVVEVGAEVSDLKPGERVMGMIDNAFGPLAISERDLLVPVPVGWSYEQAASMPIVFSTAYYGLCDLASLKSGERVLIHAGAGGVGMAAVQLAKHLGAEVFATASPAKWDALREAGLDQDHIASSRDLDFKEKFLSQTQGEGIDVVLNSLAGEFIDGSLELLRNGGRFLEIGKADLRDPEQVTTEHPGVSYRAFDLVEAGSERIGEMLAEIVGLFERGVVRPLPVASWDMRRAPEAFRFLREGKNVGKVVLTVPRPIDPATTTLITGATGGLGSLLARHLVKEHGVRHLLLVSRSGEGADGAKELKEALEELGAQVKLTACDVSDREQLEALLEKLPKKHPLGAIFHTAGALDDATIESLDPERLEGVFAPKADAAWHLHELSEGSDLSAFVLFSSAAGTLGGPGQANYAAANSFLDALASHRKAKGLPASSVAWGPWEQTSGMTSALSEADMARIARSGVLPLSDQQGLALLDAALRSDRAESLAMCLEPKGLRAQARTGALAPILSGLIRVSTQGPSCASALVAKLGAVPESERGGLVEEMVRSEVAGVLGHASAEAIDPERAFKELGFDSLAAVELRNRLSLTTGIRLGATVVFDYPTAAQLAVHLLAEATASAPVQRKSLRTQATEEPIAIVGMASRYPGGIGSPEELWELVAQGEDGISQFPTDRGWDLERLYSPDPDQPGTSYAREGGFLLDAGDFDAEFFGIGPREALATDPQQRLLLEASWEALEDAGIDPSALRESAAGVFAGIMHHDYGGSATSPAELEGYFGTGTSGSVASGRVAYELGLEGPAMTVDTACSSSLVTLHLAAQALRLGECSLALAGGATVVSTPGLFTEFSRQRGLSTDGRCKSFAEAADGVGWSEGVGMLVLERLSDAKANNHPILAVLKGSAVNQDGASNGLTAPNGPSQERVIRQALANARLEPRDIDAVEAHGTGTTLGDPIEAGALLATYGQERDKPLKLGSIKSNIGHTQAAAGVAGVIKMVMAMREGVLPKTLHVDSPSSKVDWEAGKVELLREAESWEPNGRPRRAAVSSFGISGTNAHVILEEAPAPEPAQEEKGEPLPGPTPLALSAKTQPALREAASRLHSHLQANPDLDPLDLAYSLTTTRATFEHRAVALGEGREELLGALASLAEGTSSPNALIAKATQGKLAYLFTGQGAQEAGMGKGLYEAYPAYASTLEEICAELDPHLDRSLKELLFAEPGSPQAELLNQTTFTQPALFATEVALARLFESFGLKPDLLLGHSIGEITAAHLAGVFDLTDATKLVAARGALMGALPDGGAMVAIEATEAEVKESLQGKELELSIAAINAPSSVVLSGAKEAIEETEAEWKEKGKRTKRLSVSHAFHSSLMEPMLEEFAEVAASLTYREPQIPIVSNLTGELLTSAQAQDPAYWVSHVREPVRFADGIATLHGQGTSTYLELGPGGVLSAMASECLSKTETQPTFIPTLREGRAEPEAITLAIAQAHTAGATLDWSAFFKGTGAKQVPLPTYPFQRKRYWLASTTGKGDLSAAGLSSADHPLLGAAIESPDTESLALSGRLSLSTHPWLADHAVGESVLLPGTAFLELALNAAGRLGAQQIGELTLQAPLILPPQGAVALRVSVTSPQEDGNREIQIHSRPDTEEAGEWTLHAEGTLSPQPPPTPESLETWPPQGAQPIDVSDLYERLADQGLNYGPAFQGLTAAWQDAETLYAEVSLGEEQAQEAGRFGVHPALLDAALHSAALSAEEEQGPKLPFSWSGVSLQSPGASELRVALKAEGDRLSLDLANQDGAPVATVSSLALRPLSTEQLQRQGNQEGLLGVEWAEVALPELGVGTEVDVHRCLASENPSDPAAGSRAAVSEALTAIQQWLSQEHGEDARLVLITHSAIATSDGESPDLNAAAVWGLIRSAQAEHPGRFALIDVDGSDASEQALLAVLSSEESQLAIREGRLLAPRAIRARDRKDSLLPPSGPWRLDATKRGTLESLALVPNSLAGEPLGANGVRIEMRYAGLNFRDVLIALDLYPGEAALGSEGAGVVVEVGAEVSDLEPGDRVMGMIDNAFAPLATSERDLLVRIPEGWSYEQAASVPTVFSTAYYGLLNMADLKPGERVLIHAGAGGVGMAAVQFAKHLGAEVFATASPAKWDVLREAGLEENHIASSRNLDFREKFLDQTEGEGVDVVLNSLAGEFIDGSLELLRNGGRFLEIGKADLRDHEQIAREHPGVSYLPFDLVEAGSERIGEMLAEIVELFERGALHHSPIRSWDLRRAPAAFRFLREGKNVGKVVLSVPRPLDPDATTLITGATGGLGSLLARHLVKEHGARRLLLVSRSGPRAEGAKELKAELEELGAKVKLTACDVSDRDQLDSLLGSIPQAHPLGAIFHTAGALDDATIESLDPGRLEPVFAPKADAAWHLHELTEDSDLSAFVLFSSAAGTLGGPGQGNYAAANSFLDALASHRKTKGLPATSIAWGPWEQRAGMTSRLSEADMARMARSGVVPLSDQQGLALLDSALRSDRAESLALCLEPKALRAQAQAGSLAPILTGLVRVSTQRRPGVDGAFAAKLVATPEPEQEALVVDLVRSEVAAVLGHDSAEAIDLGKAFKELGFDSLAAVELRNRLSTQSGIRLGATVVFDYPTSAQLAAHLLVEATAGVTTSRAAVRAQATEEPIAIVGMASRYPGGIGSPEELWELVAKGGDGITGFPTDRGWDLERLYSPDPDQPGTSYAREGGFLLDAGEFDAEFFGIGPREALATDPQQRLLLEASWEALEDAGIDPSSLRGEPTGVFAGLVHHDYRSDTPPELEGYIGTGTAGSVASGRVSYELGLEGPAMTVDTACSSSLVTLHLAAQALRGGECSLALAGGVTVLATPSLFTEFSRQRGLAPDGRCKAFSEGADGTAWSEGVGMLVLERLSDAQRNNHPILAVLKGSAVNQDGASNGLTAPNGPSQERVIRQALANARLEPGDIDAVEAHGTGTTLGDPIEAGALLATYGQERERPLKLGSIKSNIGHTQAAAGVAGVIKMVMAMREGVLPKTLHVDSPSSKVDWEAGEIELLREAEPWEPNGHPRRAAVSSFGISGTNAHVILEEAPASESAEEEKGEPLPGPTPLALSAKTEPALREAASRLHSHLQANPDLDPLDLAYSLTTTRATFEHRAVALGEGREELLSALASLSRGEESPNLTQGIARTDQRPVFLFPGQGSQWAGMALELLDSTPFFKQQIAACEQALSPHVDWSLEEILREEQGKWLDRLDIVQPALFALMVCLARLWQKQGVNPSALVGHSQGEIAAAHIAGALSLEDAALIIASRAKAMAKIAGKGAMLSVSLPLEDLRERIEPYGERVSLAANNGPASQVLSGEPKALQELAASCEQEGIRTQEVAVDYAAHSAQIEELREELLLAFSPVSPKSAQIPLHSTLTGELIDTAQMDGAYWYRNLREAVLLEPVLRSLLDQGQRNFIEISPHPVLAFASQETIAEALADQDEASVLGSLRRGEGGPRRFALSLAGAHAAGMALDWSAFFKGSGAKQVPLPTYPFQRKRYWLASTTASSDPSAIGLGNADHPLLGAAIESPDTESLALSGRLSLSTHPWLADHAVGESVLLPGSAFLELALNAAGRLGAQQIGELTLQAPLILPPQGAVALRVSVTSPLKDGQRDISIHSRPDTEEAGEWTLHAEGSLSTEPPPIPEPLESWPPQGAQPIDVSDLYERLADQGLNYGPAFQGLTAAWQDEETLYAEVSLGEEQAQEAGRFGVHPALLDAALHSAALSAEEEQGPKLPFSWSGVSLQSPGASELRVALKAEGDRLSLDLADQDGAPVATVSSLALRPLSTEQLQRQGNQEGLLGVEWSEVPTSGDVAVAETELWRFEPTPGPDPATSARAGAEQTLEVIQGWLAAEHPLDSRLAILTQGAIATNPEESPDLNAAAIWGLIRSAQAEHPGRFLLIDVDGSDASEQVPSGALESGEAQLAIREGRVLAPRAIRARDQERSLLPPPGPWRLDATDRGTLESLALVASPSALEPLAPTEVRIAMRVAGLNFRDVLIALGHYPGEAALGSEGAGVVVEVGAEVSDLKPGDRVMGIASNAFGPLAISERDLLVPVPVGWSYEQAASVPTVFSTAYYGLCDLADLMPGERVLIHAGAGGVGMAAVQLAQQLGAEVFATASPAKWDALREAGLDQDHIASSRDLDFKEKFLSQTQGEGIDVVLNSLAGEFIDVSLELLSSGGRFVEMGKADVRDPEWVAMEHSGVAYCAFDLIEAGSERIGEMLAEIVGLFERGVLHHSPIKSWDLRRAPEAFRFLREGKNVGKVVLTVPRPIDPATTTLITGATGGLGSLVARHLVEEHGVRHLLLVSRSGSKAEGAKELKAELEELGAKVKLAACDVSDREQLETLLEKLPKKHPLGAIFHTAGALDDATIESLDPERLERVFAPKADAAWHLHELSEGSDLSAFVLFSSAAGTLGGPGQGNYAAANSFLDALASHRKAKGLPASSIAWGPWEQTSGMTSGLSASDMARMARSGVLPLSDELGLTLLDQALGSDRAEVLALRLEPKALRAQAEAGSLAPILAGLVRVSARRQGASGTLAKRLSSAPEQERESMVLEIVRGHTATVLGHSSAQEVESSRAFKELGFDSLAAVELRNRLSTATGIRLGATVVFDYPSPARLATHLLAEATASGGSKQTAVRTQATEEPIAIVGMASRYPGGIGSPEELWELVARGGDGITGFPTDRGWDLERLYSPDPDQPGTSYAREGGFLADAGEFDAEFFGIGPREALATDPQQRLLLEASWEALEDAGIDPSALHGGGTGVFAGISSQDYVTSSGSLDRGLEGYRLAGSSTSVVSGRVAYTLGLEGPAITVDTACSSSLVAMHLAAQALRGGECSLALAGGVTVLATPSLFTEFSRQRGLAPDGRCKTFAESADGAGFAEGAGVLVLERLSDAQRNNHPILAVLKGSAVNQDGASNGLTAPNGPSQERVIRQALANARLEPGDIDAVEAHGTGTTLGDPIEAGALLATYGQERDKPLKLGSIKSNIGHTQAAAGVAGVIKMVMAMREGVLPKTLHVDSPSSKVDWEAGEIELLREAEPWEPSGHPRRAAISSFGISGTNAHVILEEAPAPEPSQGQEAKTTPLPGPTPLALSAKTEPALREAASRLHSHLQTNPDLDPLDLAYSLTTTRATFEHRAVALGEGREELLSALGSIAEGTSSPNALIAKATQGKLAYLFTGQGAQEAGMGKELYEAYPPFKEAFDQICALFDQELEESLKEIVFGTHPKAKELLDQTTFTQPALFATEVALARLFESFGLKPDLLLGHSIGEITAAHLAGVFGLTDATKLIAARGALMGALPPGGAMVAIEATEAEVKESLQGKGKELSIAAINAPTSVVLSGAKEAIKETEAHWKTKGKRTKRLAVSHAFHSALMEPMLDQFAEVAASLTYQEPQIPIVSNLTGELLTAEQATDPAYWVSHVREPVRFADGIATLHQQGTSTYLELGPGGVLSAMAAECLTDQETQPTFIPTLREGRAEPEAVTAAIAGAHTAGATFDWDAFFKGSGAKQVPLPTYPFQRKRYWLSSTAASSDPSAIGLGNADHPLLGAAVQLASGEQWLFTGRLSLQTHPWLADHAIAEAVLLPGTAFVELALRAGTELQCETLEELTLQAPLILPEQGAVQIQLSVTEAGEDGNREIQIHSRPDTEEAGEWTLHAEGTLSPEPPASSEPLPTWPPAGATEIDVTDLYQRLADQGLQYGPAFQGLTAAWQDEETLYAEVSLGEEQAQEAGRFGVHPALLDSALHTAALSEEEEQGPKLPFSWSGVSLSRQGASELRVVLKTDGDRLSLNLADQEGTPVATVSSLALRPLSHEQLRSQGNQEGLLGVEWSEVSLSGQTEQETNTELWRFEPTPKSDPATSARAATEQTLEVIQGWLAAEHPLDSRLAILTQGAIATNPEESPDLGAAAIWGLIRSAQAEHPGRFLLIDVDGSDASEGALSGALESGEAQLAIREGRVLGPKAARMAAPPEEQGASLDPNATTLITGATGGLGSLVARHLVEEHGVRHLLLVSRSGPKAEGAKELKAELEELGAKVKLTACDVSDREQLEALLGKLPKKHPLGAIFHTAGALDDATIESLDPGRLEPVFAPKADAAWHLHELSRDQDLSAFVLFSSAAGTLGGPGQGNYAAANSFLDALASHRKAQGLPASSIAWGPWEQGAGMTSGLSAADMARMARSGVLALSDQQGLALLDQALGSDQAEVLALRLEPKALRAQAQAGSLAPILAGLVRVSARRRLGVTGAFAAKLAAAAEPERETLAKELVRAEVAAVLGYGTPQEVDPDKAFKELGFDSLAAVELRNRLSAQSGIRLGATVVFDYPTSAQLAEHLLTRLSRGAPAAAEAEFERLAAALAAVPGGDSSRSRIATRLRALAVSLEGNGQAETRAPDVDRLEAASDDELFEFIDAQVGSPEGTS